MVGFYIGQTVRWMPPPSEENHNMLVQVHQAVLKASLMELPTTDT
jgi:hypothetical protein